MDLKNKSTGHEQADPQGLRIMDGNLTFRTAYGPKRKVSLSFDPRGDRTKQSFKDECDINVIMGRYLRTGIIDFVNQHGGRYGDATGMDFQTMQNTVIEAQSLFDDLPSAIRAKFMNDAGLFLDFVHNPANAKEMASMGLLTPEATSRELAPPAPLVSPTSPPLQNNP